MPGHDEFLRRGLTLLTEEVRPFVERSMLGTYGTEWKSKVLSDRGFEDQTLETNDPMVWLKVMRNFWKGTFEDVLKPYRLHTIRELLSLRHMYSHHEPLDDDDVRRGLDNIRGLLVDMQNERVERVDRLIAEFEHSIGDKPDSPVDAKVPLGQERTETAKASPNFDSLVFEQESMRDGRLVKGYLPRWHWNRPGGGYRSGRDFLWLEYEVHEPSLEVLIQVEAPNQDSDPRLNQFKVSLVDRIAALAGDEYPAMRCQVGSRANRAAAQRYKSTTVLKASVSLDASERNWVASAEAAIHAVHEVLGQALPEIWEPIEAELY
jgi:hypothetical protein